MIIRQEIKADFEEVESLIESAFKNEIYSDHQEHFLVKRLRNSQSFIPELSLVALEKNQIAGHILLTKVIIENKEQKFDSLALAPVSVHPKFQKKGIGKALIIDAHRKAEALGFKSVVLIGHKDYYPKFGYKIASKFGIQFPFDIPQENCMAIELVENGLNNVQGMVNYPKEFYE